LLLTGNLPQGNILKLYSNSTQTTNTNPTPPYNLTTQLDGDWMRFYWDASSDAQTPSSGLSYVLRIGSTPGGYDILSPMSRPSGYRLKPEKGHANSNRSWKIKRTSLPDLFYWSVQAIDTAFSGSAFSQQQEYSFVPRISLLSSNNVSFGDTPIDSITNWVDVIIKNPSAVPLMVDSVSFFDPASDFEHDFPDTGLLLSPGISDVIRIRFAPTEVGAVSDTLYIMSNAVNSPVLKVRLSGAGIHVPPNPPANLLVSMNNGTATITWDAVTETIYGTPIQPDYYLVFYNGSDDPDGVFYYHGATAQLEYTHYLVGLHAPHMFYHVVAYKFYGRNGVDLAAYGLESGMIESDVFGILRALR
ncbi:MAG: hypothetical protein Q8M66_04965, partial [Actinomycetota bacterium]|nr:hypothetical protein [Actinomycetota bacterium]